MLAQLRKLISFGGGALTQVPNPSLEDRILPELEDKIIFPAEADTISLYGSNGPIKDEELQFIDALKEIFQFRFDNTRPEKLDRIFGSAYYFYLNETGSWVAGPNNLVSAERLHYGNERHPMFLEIYTNSGQGIKEMSAGIEGVISYAFLRDRENPSNRIGLQASFLDIGGETSRIFKSAYISTDFYEKKFRQIPK